MPLACDSDMPALMTAFIEYLSSGESHSSESPACAAPGAGSVRVSCRGLAGVPSQTRDSGDSDCGTVGDLNKQDRGPGSPDSDGGADSDRQRDWVSGSELNPAP